MISATLLGDVAARAQALAGAPGGFDALLAGLRKAYPGAHITVCAEDDIPPRVPPAAENAFCRLYYVASGEHCLELTTDADAASGIVVALCGEDD